MRTIFLILVLACLCACCGCGSQYWPQTLEPHYYEEGAREVKEDIDDVSGARTL